MKSPFHSGEQAVQARASVRERAERSGRRFILTSMPDPFREFFEQLAYVIVGGTDGNGNPFASMLIGVPGFIRAPDEHTLVIDARIEEGDPIGSALTVGASMGALGIELETRSRIRANGVITQKTADRIVLSVEQSVGNCPQYIQARTIENISRRASPSSTSEGPLLSERARAIVANADTLFIASASRDLTSHDGTTGMDVSHRGGMPGFVRLGTGNGASLLTMPDFSGNHFFMTLGNLYENPRAGVLFVDFTTGDLLSLTGTTEIIWDGPEVQAFTGAERLVRFLPSSGKLLPGAIPFVWSAPGFAKQLARTGSW